MPVLHVDPDRARDVLARRAPEHGEIRILMLFKTPVDSERLLGEEFDEALGDGTIDRTFAHRIIDRLQQESVLVPTSVAVEGLVSDAVRAEFFARLSSIGRLTQRISGDLVAMSSRAEEQARVDGSAPSELLAEVVGRLEDLSRALERVRQDFLTEQLEALDAETRACENLHLGSGNYCPEGWLNVDMTGGDLQANLCWQLPFGDGQFRFAFSAHAFEHLDFHTAGPRLLREVWRVLKPGGVLRLVVPNLAAYAEAYAQGNNDFFDDFDRVRPEFGAAAGYRTPMSKMMSVGGSAVKSGMWFEHKMGYDFNTILRMLEESGFSSVRHSSFVESGYEIFRKMDSQSNAAKLRFSGIENSLFVEAKK